MKILGMVVHFKGFSDLHCTTYKQEKKKTEFK